MFLLDMYLRRYNLRTLTIYGCLQFDDSRGGVNVSVVDVGETCKALPNQVRALQRGWCSLSLGSKLLSDQEIWSFSGGGISFMRSPSGRMETVIS